MRTSMGCGEEGKGGWGLMGLWGWGCSNVCGCSAWDVGAPRGWDRADTALPAFLLPSCIALGAGRASVGEKPFFFSAFVFFLLLAQGGGLSPSAEHSG